ncbi:MAG: hypothetical protein EP343_26375 [Deltaproteobacteria bacterium]|nr:MAG: hypothetical protein EP343_26375 [Deltaproteobacteria bacterium]
MRTVSNASFFRSPVLFFIFVLALCLSVQPQSVWSKGSKRPSGVKVAFSWSLDGTLVGAQWSLDGKEVVYAVKKGKEASVHRRHILRNKHKLVLRSLNGFFPSFGPAGSIFAGPEKEKPAKVSTKKPRKVKKGKSKSKAWWKSQKGQGIALLGLGQEQYLFPGVRPSYSEKARRLLFTHHNIMYLWNPLKSRKSGLLLLARGYSPSWAPDGRGIAFLRKPFQFSPQRGPQGGGLAFVDMLFRATKVTASGGQANWSFDSKGVVWVDSIPKPSSKRKKSPAYGVFWMSLKAKQRKALLVRPLAWHPSLAPNPSKKPKHQLVAFTDPRGVWVMSLSSRKAQLVAPGAKRPLWSSRGDLMVQVSQQLHILRLSPTFRASLAGK